MADSKGWCDGTLSVVTDHRLRLLSRLPRTESLHRQLMEFPWKPTQIIERPAKRTKGQMERYELMGFDAERTVTFHRENPEDPQHPITEKKVIPVRAVRVYSSALLRTKLATLGRTRNRETRAAAKLIRHWQSIAYACEEDANRAAKRHGDQYHAITHDLKACVERHEGPVKARRGRPRKYPEPTLTKDKHWRITYQTIPVQDEISAQRLHDQASFILIRTRNPGWTITDEAMMDTYRQQYHLEHGFAWLKSGAEINPLFIQTPHRIASMGFVYCLGLLVWNVIQRTVRQYLIAHETGLPYHRGKVSNNITTRFLFELFPSVQSVVLRHPDGQREKRVVGLDKWQLASIKALGCPLNNFKPIMVD